MDAWMSDWRDTPPYKRPEHWHARAWLVHQGRCGCGHQRSEHSYRGCRACTCMAVYIRGERKQGAHPRDED